MMKGIKAAVEFGDVAIAIMMRMMIAVMVEEVVTIEAFTWVRKYEGLLIIMRLPIMMMQGI